MEDYDLELDKATAEIRKTQANLVCIQLPEGLKPKAKEIQEYIERNTGASVVIWLGSCYGACGTPAIEKLGVDLLIQWGHSEFRRAW
ncbi:diphthamide synthesis protein [Candidatus Woesearchaeota archaeon]|nr:diphthamide synthesis protein [Candidatus Woesearchaeota archaeon]